MADMHQPTSEKLQPIVPSTPPLSECRMPGIERSSEVIPDIYESVAPTNYPDWLADRRRSEDQPPSPPTP